MRIVNGWYWPADDSKLLAVLDYVNDIDHIMAHVPVDRRGICLQAGGACGVWPATFARHFRQVYTFEPVRENYDCLVRNVPLNVLAFAQCLGAFPGFADIARDQFEAGNAGAWYSRENPGGSLLVTTIDALNLTALDLLQLDVEGAELAVLQGGRDTLESFRPVVVLEEKQLPHMTTPCTMARDYLAGLGYREAGRVHRDVIFCP